MNSHGHAAADNHESHEHGAANDEHGYSASNDEHGHHIIKKRPKLAHLEDKLEDLEKEFGKDLEKYEEYNTKDNNLDIQNMVGDSHDVAYTSFKKKFDELADKNLPEDKRLAERGKDISNQHLNDLLESYIADFLIHNQGEHGKAKVEAYKSIKFEGENKENERAAYIEQLFEQAGFNTKHEKGFYKNALAHLKNNQHRHTSVLNDLAHLVKNEISGHHINQNFERTIGKSKYKQNNKLALKALNHFGKKISGEDIYELDLDEDHKSKFYRYGIEHVKEMIGQMHNEGIYIVDKDKLEPLGLKYKKAHAEHEGNHEGASHH